MISSNFTKNCTTKQNTRSQNWSKKLSLFFVVVVVVVVVFTAQRLQQQHRSQTDVTDKLAARTKTLLSTDHVSSVRLANIVSDFFS